MQLVAGKERGNYGEKNLSWFWLGLSCKQISLTKNLEKNIMTQENIFIYQNNT